MVRQRLAQPDAQEQGWLLDGYPRSAPQAEALEGEGILPDLFLLIQVSLHALLSTTRLVNAGARRGCR